MAEQFHENWKKLFTQENIGKIRAFLEWNLSEQDEYNLDTVLAKFGEKKVASVEPVEDKLATVLEKLRNDFISLAPFSIERMTLDGNPIRLIDFIDVPPAAAAKPGKDSK